MKIKVILFCFVCIQCLSCYSAQPIDKQKTASYCSYELTQKIRNAAENGYTFYGDDIKKNIQYINSKISGGSTVWDIYIFDNCTNSHQYALYADGGFSHCYIEEYLLSSKPTWIYRLIDTISFDPTALVPLANTSQSNITHQYAAVIADVIQQARALYYDHFLMQGQYIVSTLQQKSGYSYYVIVTTKELWKGWIFRRFPENQWFMYVDEISQNRYLVYRNNK